MKNRLIIGMLALSAVVCINSCENKVAIVPSAGSSTSSCPPVDTATLYYSKGIDTIINTQCAVPGCHVPRSSGADYTSYAALSSYASGGASSQFYTCLVKGTPYVMPNTPQPGWNDCVKAKLLQWVLNGAPQ